MLFCKKPYAMYISSDTKFLIKTNLILGKRITKRDSLSILVYILGGIVPVQMGFVHMTDGLPVLYMTLVAFLCTFIVSNLQMQLGIHINRYQLRIYPVSTRSVLNFLWLSELIDLKAIAFLITFVTCMVSIFVSHGIFVFAYAVYASACYVNLCLILLIIRFLQ